MEIPHKTFQWDGIESGYVLGGVYVDAYSGYKANERPRQFTLDEDNFEIEAVENQWRSPEAEYFKVRTTDGKHYLLRNEKRQDQWMLQSDFNGAKLFTRPSINLITVEAKTIREAESQIAACESYRPGVSELLSTRFSPTF